MWPTGLQAALFCVFQFEALSSWIPESTQDLYSDYIDDPIFGEIEISWLVSGDLIIYDVDVVYSTVAQFNEVLANITYQPSERQNEYSTLQSQDSGSTNIQRSQFELDKPGF